MPGWVIIGGEIGGQPVDQTPQSHRHRGSPTRTIRYEDACVLAASVAVNARARASGTSGFVNLSVFPNQL